MKRKFIAIASTFIVLLFSLFPWHITTAKADPIPEDPIDRAMKVCLEENQTTQGQLFCVNEADSQWEKELEEIFEVLRKSIDPQDQRTLANAQAKWDEYRDKEFLLVDIIYPRSSGSGTINLVLNRSRQVEVVKERVLELRHYVSYLNL